MILSQEKAQTPLLSPKESHVPEHQTMAFKIPRTKPHFRSADYDRLPRAQHIRVKLWRLHSCKFVQFHGGFSTFQGNYFEQQAKNMAMLQIFQETIKHPTLQKCLKYVRKIAFRQGLFTKDRSFYRLCTSWKLDSLQLVFTPKTNQQKMIKRFMNSKLKHCHASYRDFSASQDPDPQVISVFRRLKKCQLAFRSESSHFKMILNTDQLHPCSKSHRFIRLKLRARPQSNSNEGIIFPPNSLKKLSYNCPSVEQTSELPLFPDLQTLHWIFTNQPRKEITLDLSFIQQYSRLQSLTIYFDKVENETLDFLANLPCLKELHFSPIRSCLKNGFPNLSKLEKFSLSFDDETPLEMDYVRDFLRKNKDLKALTLNLSIQKIAAVLEDRGDPCLYDIQELKLNFRKSESQDIEAANKIAQALKTHHSIQELCIELESPSSEAHAILLKEGLGQMGSLQRLKVKFCYRKGGFSQRIKFPNLPDIFTSLKNLKALDLEISTQTFILESPELSSILDILSRLKSLKKFRFTAKFSELTTPVFEKLLSFLTSFRSLSNLQLNLRGVSDKYEKVLREALFPKFTLVQGTISFSYH